MTNLITFPRPPIRAIEVVRFNRTSNLWQASYAGDEWTEEMRFTPPMKLPEMLRELLTTIARHGLPIVVITDEAGEVAA